LDELEEATGNLSLIETGDQGSTNEDDDNQEVSTKMHKRELSKKQRAEFDARHFGTNDFLTQAERAGRRKSGMT
jgi:hypothetical protein